MIIVEDSFHRDVTFHLHLVLIIADGTSGYLSSPTYVLRRPVCLGGLDLLSLDFLAMDILSLFGGWAFTWIDKMPVEFHQEGAD